MKLTKPVFYLLSFTWGIVMTAVGCLVSAVLLLCGHKPIRNKYGWSFMIGKNWGGVDLGMCSIVNENPTQHIVDHEFGHAVQNCFWGPLMVFVIAVPSAIRYWYREFLMRSGRMKASELPSYDSIWFEGQA